MKKHKEMEENLKKRLAEEGFYDIPHRGFPSKVGYNPDVFMVKEYVLKEGMMDFTRIDMIWGEVMRTNFNGFPRSTRIIKILKDTLVYGDLKCSKPEWNAWETVRRLARKKIVNPDLKEWNIAFILVLENGYWFCKDWQFDEGLTKIFQEFKK